MERIDELIKEVQTFFINKILNKEFDIVKPKLTSVHINIEGYDFEITAISENYVHIIDIDFDKSSAINLNFTDEEKQKVFEILNPIIEEAKREKALEEFNKLKSQLNL